MDAGIETQLVPMVSPDQPLHLPPESFWAKVLGLGAADVTEERHFELQVRHNRTQSPGA